MIHPMTLKADRLSRIQGLQTRMGLTYETASRIVDQQDEKWSNDWHEGGIESRLKDSNSEKP